jgi:hypothetical protein
MSTSELESDLGLGSAALPARRKAPIAVVRSVADRTILFEALAASAMALAVALILWPSDAGLRRHGPHLVWIAILLLAARYGTKGLLLSLSFSAVSVVALAEILGEMRALRERLDGGADLVALVAALLVGWVASTQEGRRHELVRALDAVKNGALADRQAAREMQNALVALRSRADRMNLSLTFLRRVAEGLEGGDPEEAAGAALTLAMTCLDARAGVVKLIGSSPTGALAATPDGGATLLSCSGAWNSDGATPTLDGDRVVAAALRGRGPARAIDIEAARMSDADMAAPLLDGHGEPFGVLAVRGIPFGSATTMELHDLAVASGWLASVLTHPGRRVAPEAESRAETDDPGPDYLEVSVSRARDAEPPSTLEARS